MGHTEQVKGICDYCHMPVEVRVNEAWHSKGDKVWHEVCSFTRAMEALEDERDRLRESNEELVKWAGAALKAEFGGLDAANLAPGTYWAHLQVAIRRATSGGAQEGARDDNS